MSGTVTRAPGAKALSKDNARQLTDQIRADAQSLWMQLLRAYEGNAHNALGYTNWADYCAAEFDFSKTRSYRLLQAARVIETAELPMGDSGIETERVAREFTPLVDDPDKLRAAHAEAVSTAPRDDDGKPKVTATAARKAVTKRRDPKPPANTGTTLRPATAPEKPAPIGLNVAVANVHTAVKRDPATARDALQALRESAAAGLYRPETTDAKAAAIELVEVVALLLNRPS